MADVTPLLLVNPASGGGRARKLLPAVAEELDRANLRVEMRIGGGVDASTKLFAAAADDGRPILAMGGDGLVHLALQAAVGHVPLGIIPAGSGNDFARALGIPIDVRAAVAAIASGRRRHVDLGRIDGPDGFTRYFGAIADAGFDGEVTAVANRIHVVAGTLKYVVAMLATLRSWRGASFTVDVDGETRSTPGWFVAVGNGSSYGSGMRICPEADLHDDALEVTVVGDTGLREFLGTFPKVFAGTHLAHPKVTALRGKTVTLSSDKPFRCFADGEDLCDLPVTLTSVPDAIEILG